MKIEVGKYLLTADRYCMWISEEVESENGKSRYERLTGYRTEFDKLISDFVDTKVLDRDASTMVEVIEHLKQALKDVKALNEAALEGDFESLEELAEKIGELNKG